MQKEVEVRNDREEGEDCREGYWGAIRRGDRKYVCEWSLFRWIEEIRDLSASDFISQRMVKIPEEGHTQ